MKKRSYNYWETETVEKVKIKISKAQAERLHRQLKSIQLGQLSVNSDQLSAMVDVVSILRKSINKQNKR